MMQKPRISDFHVLVAIACYLACFFFPAFYVGDDFEPQSPLGSLLIGWAAALELNLGWFANPAFVVAVLSARSRPRFSAMLAGAALVLALSFLLYRYVRVHEIASQSLVTAYGWGYALWVTSMTVLASGQLARAYGARKSLCVLAGLLSGGVALIAYGIYAASGSGGLHALTKERDRVFEASCATAGMQIARRAEDVHGVYMDPDWSWQIAPRSADMPELRYRTRGTIMRSDFLRSGKLEFVETPASEGQQGYLRFGPGDTDGVPVQRLQSTHAVHARAHDFPFHLSLQGETILIKDRRDGSVLASARYVMDRQTARYCGPLGNTFSTQAFVADVLGLAPHLR